MPEPDKMIHLRLPADTAERLRILAEHDERSMAWQSGNAPEIFPIPESQK